MYIYYIRRLIIICPAKIDVLTTWYLSVEGPKCKPTKSWYAQPGASFNLPGFCPSTATVHKGDFNGDGRMDLMCHDSSHFKLYYGSKTGYSDIGWFSTSGWCSHGGASVYVGDFNGDSQSDVLCHDTNGKVFIAFANNAGGFDGGHVWNANMGFCTGGADRKLFIGDFDGDGRSDMLCHNSHTGHKKIAYANVGGDFENPRTWNKNMHWCYKTNPKLYVGDFNGDGKDDMLCRDDNSNMCVAIARSGGTFVGPDYRDNLGICRAEGCTLSVARASRDTKADIVCHCKDPNPEPIIIRFPYGRHSFEIFRQWRRNRMWCTGASDELVVGPLKPGRCGVLVCIDRVAKTASIANAG